MSENDGASRRSSSRTTTVPLRLRNGGEPVAAAGHGLGPPSATEESHLLDLQLLASAAGRHVDDVDDHGSGGTESSDDDDFNVDSVDIEQEIGRAPRMTEAQKVDDFRFFGRESVGGNNAKKAKPTAGEGSLGVKKSPNHAAAEKARGKAYLLWSGQLLKRACAYRKIANMSAISDKTVLSNALTGHDEMMQRASPFFEDLKEIADGKAGSGAQKGKADAIPAGAVLAFRSLRGMISVPRDSSQSLTFDKRLYKFSDLFALMDKEDAPSGGAGAGGSDSSSTSVEAGTGGGVSERKGPHCMMRLVGILCEDDVRPLLIASRLQASRAQLDVRAVGARGEVWTVACERFRDPNHQVVKIVDDAIVEHINPNIIGQPNISPEKLSKMWAAGKSKWGPSHANWKGESGNNQPWIAFCQGDTDTYIIGEAVETYPELNQVCSNLLPDGTQREDDGTGGDGNAAGGVARREAAKREGARLHDLNNEGKSAKKKKNKSEEVQRATDASLDRAFEKFAPLLQSNGVGGCKWLERTRAWETKSAALAHSEDLLSSHIKFEKALLEEEGLGEKGSAARKAFLQKQIAEIEKNMLEGE